MTTHNELMAEATQNYAMAHHYLGKLKVTLDQLSAVQSGIAQASRPPVRCVREWQDWLAANGPTEKGGIQAATGIKFTERGTPYTVEWTPALAEAVDDRFAPHTLMKINTKPDGRGAPPKVYFLWSQRFDVHPLFGVGPIKSDADDLDEQIDRLHGAGAAAALDAAIASGEIPTSPDTETAGTDAVSEPETVRFATIEEWDGYYAPLFDTMVAAESKATDAQKQVLRDTLPDGADANAAIAIAYRNATLRSRQGALLGVIHPPGGDGVVTHGNWDDIPFDWPEPESHSNVSDAEGTQ